MAHDYSRDALFLATLRATEQAILVLDEHGIDDASALVDRQEGVHNLQGHVQRLVPLAVWLVRQRPNLLRLVKESTDINHNMTSGSSEARNDELWSQVQTSLRALLASSGDDILTVANNARSPTTASQAAETYLHESWGGGQVSGGGGGTVIKRTVKILSHVLHA